MQAKSIISLSLKLEWRSEVEDITRRPPQGHVGIVNDSLVDLLMLCCLLPSRLSRFGGATAKLQFDVLMFWFWVVTVLGNLKSHVEDEGEASGRTRFSSTATTRGTFHSSSISRTLEP